MKIKENCSFCDPNVLANRIIKEHELFISFVSNPRFIEGQCLVIPRRHIVRIHELDDTEAAAIMFELGRLSVELDKGHGTEIVQQHKPLIVENGIKMNHLHFHVFPRTNNESGLFSVPTPNSYEGFHLVDNEEVVALAEDLK